jgi:N-acetyl-anhydromuramyl-L-alanine amidase AmpD
VIEAINRWLPDQCYASTRVLSAVGILLHHISASKSRPDAPYDVDSCYRIFVDLKVSAHYMIARDGTLYRLVPEDRVAWHAGMSRFRNLEDVNRYFFGVEFIGSEHDFFTDAQYRTGASLLADLMRRYPIATHMITGHEIVSTERVRPDPKHDPGQCFDWLRLGGMLQTARGVLL